MVNKYKVVLKELIKKKKKQKNLFVPKNGLQTNNYCSGTSLWDYIFGDMYSLWAMKIVAVKKMQT